MFECRRSDDWRLLLRPFKQVIVATHYEFRMRSPRKGDEVVVVRISCRGRYRFGVGHLRGSGSECQQVAIRVCTREPAPHVDSIEDVADLSDELRAYN